MFSNINFNMLAASFLAGKPVPKIPPNYTVEKYAPSMKLPDLGDNPANVAEDSYRLAQGRVGKERTHYVIRNTKKEVVGVIADFKGNFIEATLGSGVILSVKDKAIAVRDATGDHDIPIRPDDPPIISVIGPVKGTETRLDVERETTEKKLSVNAERGKVGIGGLDANSNVKFVVYEGRTLPAGGGEPAYEPGHMTDVRIHGSDNLVSNVKVEKMDMPEFDLIDKKFNHSDDLGLFEIGNNTIRVSSMYQTINSKTLVNPTFDVAFVARSSDGQKEIPVFNMGNPVANKEDSQKNLRAVAPPAQSPQKGKEL